jgi:DNA-binding FrmR family transcriptional regulator
MPLLCQRSEIRDQGSVAGISRQLTANHRELSNVIQQIQSYRKDIKLSAKQQKII